MAIQKTVKLLTLVGGIALIGLPCGAMDTFTNLFQNKGSGDIHQVREGGECRERCHREHPRSEKRRRECERRCERREHHHDRDHDHDHHKRRGEHKEHHREHDWKGKNE